MGFSRREYWSGLPGPPPGVFLTQGSKLCVLCLLLWPVLSPGDLPNLGIEPQSPTLKVDSLWSEPPGKPLALAGGFFTTSTTWETPDLSVNRVSFTLLSSRLPNVNALPRFTVQARIQPGKWHSLWGISYANGWNLIQRILYIGVNRLKEQKVRCSTLRENEEEM